MHLAASEIENIAPITSQHPNAKDTNMQRRPRVGLNHHPFG